MDSNLLLTPKAIAERGERIYQEKYQVGYEREHLGEFVAIDVLSEKAYLGATPESALDSAKDESPMGLFHLIQIGSPAAYRVSYANNATIDWVFQ